MQEIIERILEGNFDYENGSLDFSCSKIEFTMPKDSVYEGSFHIISSPGQITNGFITSSDIRMECLTPEFSGSEAEIFYCFHSGSMEEGRRGEAVQPIRLTFHTQRGYWFHPGSPGARFGRLSFSTG